MSDSVPYVLAAILDVLGYRDRLARDRESGGLEFKDALHKAIDVLSHVNQAQYSYQAISDTIIVTRTDDADLIGLLTVLKNVHLAFMREGLLIRGGVAYERHFWSSNITYSHALAIAHQVESTMAIYPRIVIDNNVIEVQKTKGFWPEVAKTHLVCECNGVHFLNVLDKGNWSDVYGWAKRIYEIDQKSLTGKEKEFSKHAWFENYLFTSLHAILNPDYERYIPIIKLSE
jgi:hypothetical protein